MDNAAPPVKAYKARYLVPFADEKPARGRNLFSPLAKIDNGWISIAAGRILETGKKKPYYPNCEYVDLGNVAILPAVVNCHTHLQLSWLAGKTETGRGFTVWLKSLVKGLLPAVSFPFSEAAATQLNIACKNLRLAGTGMVGDVGGSLPDSLQTVKNACLANDIETELFCEHFGFANSASIWPTRCRNSLENNPALKTFCAPCGHALYSTSSRTLQLAHKWCRQNKHTFTFHLAESPEETEMLTCGAGPLYDFYKDMVLPPNWKAPELTPFEFAEKTGILSPNTLAVHCVHLQGEEIGRFAQTGAGICLCTRSNQIIAEEQAPVKEFIQANILLCLGTDGLCSSPDLDIRNEAAFLHARFDLPWRALWRMTVSNGARMLGKPQPRLTSGQPSCFSVWNLE